jgi:hypothetical protein
MKPTAIFFCRNQWSVARYAASAPRCVGGWGYNDSSIVLIRRLIQTVAQAVDAFS